jgi:hypothetical protein
MRYAMPVAPEVLLKDFESDPVVHKIPEIVNLLKTVITPEEFKRVNASYGITKILSKLWFYIDTKQGINLRDREKLVPVYQELNRIFSKLNKNPKVVYRGVSLPRYNGTALTETFPYSIKDPKVLLTLEQLAYGLRSWTDDLEESLDWGTKNDDGRDQVIFKVQMPDIVLEADSLLKMDKENFKLVFDTGEILLNMKNPQILLIKKRPEQDNLFMVSIKDNI